MLTPSSNTPALPLNPLIKRLPLVASVSLFALMLLCLGWELWWAPLRPGGSWLVMKAVLLLLPLRGILHCRRYTYQWTSLFLLFYLFEGSSRSMSDTGLSQSLAQLELVLTIVCFGAIVTYLRVTRPPKPAKPEAITP